MAENLNLNNDFAENKFIKLYVFNTALQMVQLTYCAVLTRETKQVNARCLRSGQKLN